MSNGLHLELDKKQIPGSTLSQGVLTLEKAGPFTVQIKEYLEYPDRRSKLNLTKGRTLVDSPLEKEKDGIAALSKKFETVNWSWNTVYSLQNPGNTQNLFVAKGFPIGGKTFTFPKVLEGGGYCYVEAFFEGESPVGKIPNGLLVRAIGTPKIIRVEWTDMQYIPIKDKKVAFGSHLLLHVYTEGLYGQEILVGLKDINGIDDDLNVANSSFFEREVKTYPVKPFEENHGGVSGQLVRADNKQSATNVQKAEIEVGIDHAWIFAGKELEIQACVIQKSTQKSVKIQDDDTILNVSMSHGKRYSYTQEITNTPVVVGEIDTVAKPLKKAIDFTFGVFIDGTMNNMYDTEVRKKALEDKEQADTTGLYVSKTEANLIYKDHGDLEKLSSSYENDLSNPAILFKNYKEEPKEKIFKVYTEGMGTNTAPKEQGAILTKDDYKKDDIMFGPAFGQGTAGIMDRVKKSIEDVVKKIVDQKIQKDKECVGTITFDVFGFSRGAAAARHFVHIITHGPYIAEKSLTMYSNGLGPVVDRVTKDLQNNMISDDYEGKVMPQFGNLGQLLTEAELMDDVLTKVNVRFVGIYDTVPHHGLVQSNDIKDLGLDNVNRADYVVHIAAADEHRANFSLVDISTVAKVSPESGKKGGIELFFPGVHCDVGGSYEEGRIDNPKRIDAATSEKELVPLREELIQQGWFKDPEIKIILDPLFKLSSGINRFRLDGSRKLSNQYSYIPLHHMAEFCTKKSVPVDKKKLIKFKNFKDNFIEGNVAFLQGVKEKLYAYSFESGPEIVFRKEHIKPVINPVTKELDKDNIEYNIQEGLKNSQIKFLRNHYLHWNSTYGEEGVDVAVQTNYPNKLDGRRKRKIR